MNYSLLLFNNYLYVFFYRFGPQRSNNIFQSTSQNTKPGDLIFDGERYYLNLGDEISRPEQGHTSHTITLVQRIISVCSLTSLERMHWMVNERFSSYNKVIPLFLGNDLALLLKYRPKFFKKQTLPQHLFIFPSILSIQQYLNTQPEDHHNITLTGSSTVVQKAKGYRAISHNTQQDILTTYSQIFQNWNNLTEITLMDPHSPYYRTFQDPRYNIPLVIDKMKELYQISSD